VVCSAGARAVEDELTRLNVPQCDRILNPAPDRGMFSSIQCAAAWPGWKPELTHWAIVLGDQPQVGAATLRTLIAFGAAHPAKICQPICHGHRRHPVLLPKAAFGALNGCTATDLKQFLKSRAAEWAGFESDDAGLDFDMDTPADYERALRFWEEQRQNPSQE
jgi:CTP:molybdopterin cytidylyltransferase MocA